MPDEGLRSHICKLKERFKDVTERAKVKAEKMQKIDECSIDALEVAYSV